MCSDELTFEPEFPLGENPEVELELQREKYFNIMKKYPCHQQLVPACAEEAKSSLLYLLGKFTLEVEPPVSPFSKKQCEDILSYLAGEQAEGH
jgi:hypothetical protein